MTLAVPAVGRAYGRARSLHRRYIGTQQQHWKLLIGLQAAYCVLLFVTLIWSGNWPTADQVAIGLFGFAILTARPLSFLRDWFPFIFLVLSYEALRGMSDGLVANAHIGFPITADKTIFDGTVPTIWLQDHLWDPNHLHWYDYVAAFMHPLHFIAPIAIALAFWMRSKKLYWKFVASYLLLTYAGLITYLLYPMAPPWYAADIGRLPHVETILGQVLWTHSASHPIGFIYNHFDPNPVAAMPSLHAAFPVLVFCVFWRLSPRWGWLTFVYPLLMDFSIVYMGEHYVIDALVGSLYGAAAFAAVWVLPDVIARRRAANRQGPHEDAPPRRPPVLAGSSGGR